MTCYTVAFYGQVGLMQDELRVLQPQLIDTSEKTEKLMIKIEQDTVVVEAKKEVLVSFIFLQKCWCFCVTSQWSVFWI
jgi:hypothetical protein